MSAVRDYSFDVNWNVCDDKLNHASVPEIKMLWVQDLWGHYSMFPDVPFSWSVHLLRNVMSHINDAKAQAALSSLVKSGLLIEGENEQISLPEDLGMRAFLASMIKMQPMKRDEDGVPRPYIETMH